MAEAPELRVSDADRERVAVALRDHTAPGRLTLDEFSERLDRVYAARTRAELEEIAADLPAPPARDAGPRRRTRWLVAVMSGVSRRGRWRIDGRTTVVALMGGAELDLRGAEIAGSEVTITCITIMGGVDVTVPEGVDVEVSGFAFMGGHDEHVTPPPPGADVPLIRIRAFCLMGGVDVKSKPPKRRSGLEPPAPPRLGRPT